MKIQKTLLLAFGILFIYSCKKTEINPNKVNNSEQTSTISDSISSDSLNSKTIPFGQTPNGFRTQFINQLPGNYDITSTWWAVKFNDDNITDLIERKSNGDLFYHRGYHYGNTVPDIIGDPYSGLTFGLAAPKKIGHGFNGVQYIWGDVNGDSRADLMQLNSDGNLWLYTSAGEYINDGIRQYRSNSMNAPFDLNSKYMLVDLNGDNQYNDLVEIGYDFLGHYQIVRRKQSNGNGWSGIVTQYSQSQIYDPNDEYIVMNLNNIDGSDVIIRKSNGLLFRCHGTSNGIGVPVQCGIGWSNFNKITGKQHLNYTWPGWPTQKMPTLVGRHLNGDLYLYKYLQAQGTFESNGTKIGNGWGNMVNIFCGNFFDDGSNRDDFIGLHNNGKMYSYCSLIKYN